MKSATFGSVEMKFGEVISSRSVQAAIVNLQSSDAIDDQLANEHPRSEQWLYVVSGTGTLRFATSVRTRSKKTKSGDLVLIEKGERHPTTGVPFTRELL